jgi:hypothetical protein
MAEQPPKAPVVPIRSVHRIARSVHRIARDRHSPGGGPDPIGCAVNRRGSADGWLRIDRATYAHRPIWARGPRDTLHWLVVLSSVSASRLNHRKTVYPRTCGERQMFHVKRGAPSWSSWTGLATIQISATRSSNGVRLRVTRPRPRSGGRGWVGSGLITWRDPWRHRRAGKGHPTGKPGTAPFVDRQ